MLEVISAPVFLNLVLFFPHQRLVDLLAEMAAELLSDLPIELGKPVKSTPHFVFPNCKALQICLCSIDEGMSFVKTDLKSSNIGGHAEPCLIELAVIDLKAYVIEALLNKKNLKRLVHFLHNYLTFFVNTYF